MNLTAISDYIVNNQGDIIFDLILLFGPALGFWLWKRVSKLVSNVTKPYENPFDELSRILSTLCWQVGFFCLYIAVLLTVSRVAPNSAWGTPTNLTFAGIGSGFTLAWCFYRSGWKILKIRFPQDAAKS